MNEYILSAIDSHLERIAVALEAMVEQRDHARQAETRRLLGEYQSLVERLRVAEQRFATADRRLAAQSAYGVTKQERERVGQYEDEAIALDVAVRAFRAAHPEVVALAEEEAAHVS